MNSPRLASWSDFVRAVRRFPQTGLLEQVAGLASRLAQTDEVVLSLTTGAPTSVTHFSLAAVARVSATQGNNYRRAVPSPLDVARLCDVYLNVGDAFDLSAPDGLERFLVQTAYEQFVWQQTAHHDVGRSQALFADAVGRHPTGGLTSGFEQNALGGRIAQYVSALLVWHAGAMRHGGFVQQAWLDQANFEPVLDAVGRDMLEDVLERLCATPAELRDLEQRNNLSDPKLARFQFNPLLAKPIVKLADGRLLAPQPMYIRYRMSAGSIYYDLVHKMGSGFARDLGEVFERYVGDQLALLRDCELYEQVEYERGSRTVDFFLATPSRLVLIEVKSKRLVAESRAGGLALAADLRQGLGKAFDQIRRTARLIDNRHPSLDHLPRRDSVAGMVITLEPYFAGHLETLREASGNDPGVPTIVASSAEVEHLGAIAQQGDAGAVIDESFDEVRDPGVAPRFDAAFYGAPYGRNPLLDEAWSKYAFRE